MRHFQIATMLIVLIFILSCSEEKYTYGHKGYVTSFAVDSHTDNSIVINVHSQAPDLCDHYDDYSVTTSDSSVQMRIWVKRSTGSTCAQVLREMDSQVEIPLTGSGPWLIQFWTWSDRTLDTLITSN